MGPLFRPPPKFSRPADFDEPPGVPVGTRRRRIYQNPRLPSVTFRVRIDAFSDTCGVVAAFEGQFPDQQVRQRVEHHIADTWKSFVRVELSGIPPTPMPSEQIVVPARDCPSPLPL